MDTSQDQDQPPAAVVQAAKDLFPHREDMHGYHICATCGARMLPDGTHIATMSGARIPAVSA